MQSALVFWCPITVWSNSVQKANRSLELKNIYQNIQNQTGAYQICNNMGFLYWSIILFLKFSRLVTLINWIWQRRTDISYIYIGVYVFFVRDLVFLSVSFCVFVQTYRLVYFKKRSSCRATAICIFVNPFNASFLTREMKLNNFSFVQVYSLIFYIAHKCSYEFG